MLTYKPRLKTTRVILHASHTHPDKSNLQAFLAVRGRTMGLLEVGYHYLILQDGKLVGCRPHNVQGTHTKGANRDSIGVCLAGGLGWVPCEDCSRSGFVSHPATGEPTYCPACKGNTAVEGPEDNFTEVQLATLCGLMDYLSQFYGELPLRGHSEVSPRHHHECPPIDMEKVREWVSLR